MSSHGRLFNNRCIISIQHSVNYTKWCHFVKPYAPHAEARCKNHGIKVTSLALKSLVLSRKSPHVARTVRFLFFNRPFIRPMTFLSGEIDGGQASCPTIFPVPHRHFMWHPRYGSFGSLLLLPFCLFAHMFISYHQLVSKPTGVTRLVCKMRGNSYGMRFRDIFGSSRLNLCQLVFAECTDFINNVLTVRRTGFLPPET